MQQYGKYIIAIGLIISLIGFVMLLLGDKLTWLGNLPGDIKIEKKNVKIYIPITTMIIVSIVLSLMLYLIRKIF